MRVASGVVLMMMWGTARLCSHVCCSSICDRFSYAVDARGVFHILSAQREHGIVRWSDGLLLLLITSWVVLGFRPSSVCVAFLCAS